MNEQTEKLENNVYNIVISNRHNIDLGSHTLTTLILEACKKAGLKFVTYYEKRELGTGTLLKGNAFEEIELS